MVDLPGVGQNLHDHVQLLIYHPSRWFIGDAAFTAEAGLFMHSQGGSSSSATSPDLQFHVLGDFPGRFANPRRAKDGHSFLICPVLCRPQSRGTVRLCPTDPLHDPIIDPNYLGCDADVQVLLRGIEWAEHFARLGDLGKLLDRAARPYVQRREDLRTEVVDLPDSTSDRTAILKQAITTVWHPGGTCKMGIDQLAVVDPQLRVRGVEGLRVADASIMPVVTSGNTNAVCYMIGEMCAAALSG